MVYESFSWLTSSLHRKSSNKTLTELAATLCPQTTPPDTTSCHQNHFTITEHVWMNHSKMKNSLLIEGLLHFEWNKPSARQYHWIPRTVCRHKSLPKSSEVGQKDVETFKKFIFTYFSSFSIKVTKNLKLKLLEKKHPITQQPWEAACTTIT